jgi:hypothetical protein
MTLFVAPVSQTAVNVFKTGIGFRWVIGLNPADTLASVEIARKILSARRVNE